MQPFLASKNENFIQFEIDTLAQKNEAQRLETRGKVRKENWHEMNDPLALGAE